MTETTKQVFENYQVRKSRKQKTAFIEYVKQISDSYGYNLKVEKGSFRSRNIVVGDIENAKVIYTAHYDTCAKLPFPNFITPKNIFFYLLYQILLVAGIFIIEFAVGFICGLILSYTNINDDTYFAIITWIPQIVCFVLIYLLLFGPANKHTANDNTSGITTLLNIMADLPNNYKDKVAFVFFDLEEAGLIGSTSFASMHKNIKNNSLVLNFDCVSDGETMLFALKKSTQKYESLLKQAFLSTEYITVDIAKKGVFYPSDNASFKGGIGVAALKKSKFLNTLYMNRIHTKRDVVYRDENIEFLKDGAIKLVRILQENPVLNKNQSENQNANHNTVRK